MGHGYWGEWLVVVARRRKARYLVARGGKVRSYLLVDGVYMLVLVIGAVVDHGGQRIG